MLKLLWLNNFRIIDYRISGHNWANLFLAEHSHFLKNIGMLLQSGSDPIVGGCTKMTVKYLHLTNCRQKSFTSQLQWAK